MFKNVYVAGYGLTDFREEYGRGKTSMMIDVGLQALVAAGIRRHELGRIYLSGDKEADQDRSVVERMLKSDVGVHIVGYGEGSGVEAMEIATKDIELGLYDNVMIVGATKLSKQGTCFSNKEDERANLKIFHGVTGTVEDKWIKQSYVWEGIDYQNLAMVPFINHIHGAGNPNAYFKKPIKYNTILKTISEPEQIGAFEIQPDECDGAAAIILSSKKRYEKNVSIKGFGYSSMPEVNSKKRHEMPFIHESFRKALDNSGVKKDEINLIELHDKITPLEPIILNQFEMFNINETNEVLSNSFKEFTAGAKSPSIIPYKLQEPLYVNTRGGHKAGGYPNGAGDLAKYIEIIAQLSNQCGKRQIDGVKFGAVHSMNQLRNSMVGVIGYE